MKEKDLLAALNARCKNTLMETLNIEYIKAGKDFLEAKMPVNARVHQPMGLLHGGASIALAESVGSAASSLLADPSEFAILGLEISARHLKSVAEGVLIARASLRNQTRSTHLWEIEIRDEKNQLISLCHITNMIKPLRKV
jgi:1,4-dihydroxy-2-naphthoyl-CoA hydrolase